MNPISVTIEGHKTIKVYHVEPELWLKVTNAPNSIIRYEWYMGDTWGSSKQGSNTGLYAAYYGSIQNYTFMWNNHITQKLHRMDGPAKIIIKKDTKNQMEENISIEWYIEGELMPPVIMKPIHIYYDPLGKKVTKDQMEEYARVEFMPAMNPSGITLIPIGAINTPININNIQINTNVDCFEHETSQNYANNTFAKNNSAVENLKNDSKDNHPGNRSCGYSDSFAEYSREHSDSFADNIRPHDVDFKEVLTFNKLAEVVFTNYLNLTVQNPDSGIAAELFNYYTEIKGIAVEIIQSGLVDRVYMAGANNIIDTYDFRYVYNIYMAQKMKQIGISHGLGNHINMHHISMHRIFMQRFFKFGIDTFNKFSD